MTLEFLHIDAKFFSLFSLIMFLILQIEPKVIKFKTMKGSPLGTHFLVLIKACIPVQLDRRKQILGQRVPRASG